MRRNLKRLPVIHDEMVPDLVDVSQVQLHTPAIVEVFLFINEIGHCLHLYIYLLLFIKDTSSLGILLLIKSSKVRYVSVLSNKGHWGDL